MIPPELSLLVHEADIAYAKTLELRVINPSPPGPLPGADSYDQGFFPVGNSGRDGHDLVQGWATRRLPRVIGFLVRWQSAELPDQFPIGEDLVACTQFRHEKRQG